MVALPSVKVHISSLKSDESGRRRPGCTFATSLPRVKLCGRWLPPSTGRVTAQRSEVLVDRQFLLAADAQGFVELAPGPQDVGDLAHGDGARADIGEPWPLVGKPSTTMIASCERHHRSSWSAYRGFHPARSSNSTRMLNQPRSPPLNAYDFRFSFWIFDPSRDKLPISPSWPNTKATTG